MTRRRKILIATAVVLALALIALVVYLLTRPASTPSAPEPVVETPADGLPTSDSLSLETPPEIDALNPPPEEELEQGPAGHMQMAELFAERYGSYSNQEAYANLRDLLPIMTNAYRARSEAQIASAEGQPPAATYEGVTSVKVSTKQIAFDEDGGTATVDVTLQQSKATGTSDPAVAYRTLRLRLEKAGDDWRVDSAAWQN